MCSIVAGVATARAEGKCSSKGLRRGSGPVAVGDEDWYQRFARNYGFDPRGEVVRLLFGKGRVNEDGFLVPAD